MRVSIPGLPGVYYDTDSGSTAIGVASTAIGRKAPKPQGYAIQLLPYVWSFDVDLREVPNDHPIQYLHPEGARSFGELSPQRGVREAGNELESVLRFVWSINQEVESTANELIGRGPEKDGVVIEIEEGRVSVGGDELATDEFDLEESSAAETSSETVIEIDEGAAATETDTDANADVEIDTDSEPDSNDSDEDVFGGTEEAPSDESFDTDADAEFGADGPDESDDVDPDEP